jgi:hypothetical protein
MRMHLTTAPRKVSDAVRYSEAPLQVMRSRLPDGRISNGDLPIVPHGFSNVVLVTDV